MGSLLPSMEEKNGEVEIADAAEKRLFEQIRHAGNSALQSWRKNGDNSPYRLSLRSFRCFPGP